MSAPMENKDTLDQEQLVQPAEAAETPAAPEAASEPVLDDTVSTAPSENAEPVTDAAPEVDAQEEPLDETASFRPHGVTLCRRIC